LIAPPSFHILNGMQARRRALCAGGTLVVLLSTGFAAQAPRTTPAAGFASEIERLSEPPGAFDTDNLISNEGSYLDVIPGLVSDGITGGAYLGVGPDQNFSYIARIRPRVAYIVDVRRDNLLLHLLFKALFSRARNRAEYLSLLTGRPPPEDAGRWNDARLERIVEYIDLTPASEDAIAGRAREVAKRIATFGVPLSPAEYDTIDRFHGTFIRRGLALRFQSHGRPPQSYYPSYRDLLLSSDATGRRWNFLASEDDFQFLKKLQADDRVVPVVGDVGGAHALEAIAKTLSARGERVSAVYISNVERYLIRGQYERYLDNLARLPRDRRSVIIRSIFGGGESTSVVQRLDEMLARLGGQR
jgi:hypothetical protein